MLLPEKLTPFRELDAMDRRMRRFFADIGVMPTLAPAADVYETEGEVVVELEVPGFDEKELDIQIHDHTLGITGERHVSTEKSSTVLHVHERLETHFERRFELPPEIDSKHVTAEYGKGVLTVHVPKTSRESPHKVAITKA